MNREYTPPIAAIQGEIAHTKELDGWLLYGGKVNNPIALHLLGFSEATHLSRRFFYWIPKKGNPVALVHAIEAHLFQGEMCTYKSLEELSTLLERVVGKNVTVAMECSDLNPILDAATYLFLEKQGIFCKDSWLVAKKFISILTQEQKKLHLEAAKVLQEAVSSAYHLLKKHTLTEYDLQQHIVEFLAAHNCITNYPPICAVNENSALPHYSPEKGKSAKITPESVLLIDLWAKKKKNLAPYADHTYMAFTGKNPPKELLKHYAIVEKAQSSALLFIEEALQEKIPLTGASIDDVARGVIAKEGLLQFFLHRTGHNIYTKVHADGPNIDNFETHDTRVLQPNTCYSIEPGIYFPEKYGIRLECNCIIEEKSLIVTGKAPQKLLLL